MQEQLKGTKVVPLGQEMVENRTWRARWERANPGGKKAMREAVATREDPLGVMATMKLLGDRAEQQGMAPLQPATGEQNGSGSYAR